MVTHGAIRQQRVHGPLKMMPLSKDRGFFCACFVVSYKLGNYVQAAVLLLAVSGSGHDALAECEAESHEKECFYGLYGFI